jgi:hypothetical protein
MPSNPTALISTLILSPNMCLSLSTGLCPSVLPIKLSQELTKKSVGKSGTYAKVSLVQFCWQWYKTTFSDWCFGQCALVQSFWKWQIFHKVVTIITGEKKNVLMVGCVQNVFQNHDLKTQL